MALPKVPVPADTLAVTGFVLAVIFAVLAAIPASRWVILAVACSPRCPRMCHACSDR